MVHYNAMSYTAHTCVIRVLDIKQNNQSQGGESPELHTDGTYPALGPYH